MHKKRGVTIMEIMVASTLVIVLSFGVFGMFAKTRNASKEKQCLNNLSLLAKACEFYSARHNSAYPDSLDDLVAANYVGSLPVCPFGSGSSGQYGYQTNRNPVGYTTTYTVFCSLYHPGKTACLGIGSLVNNPTLLAMATTSSTTTSIETTTTESTTTTELTTTSVPVTTTGEPTSTIETTTTAGEYRDSRWDDMLYSANGVTLSSGGLPVYGALAYSTLRGEYYVPFVKDTANASFGRWQQLYSLAQAAGTTAILDQAMINLMGDTEAQRDQFFADFNTEYGLGSIYNSPYGFCADQGLLDSWIMAGGGGAFAYVEPPSPPYPMTIMWYITFDDCDFNYSRVIDTILDNGVSGPALLPYLDPAWAATQQANNTDLWQRLSP